MCFVYVFAFKPDVPRVCVLEIEKQALVSGVPPFVHFFRFPFSSFVCWILHKIFILKNDDGQE